MAKKGTDFSYHEKPSIPAVDRSQSENSRPLGAKRGKAPRGDRGPVKEGGRWPYDKNGNDTDKKMSKLGG